MLWPVLGEGHCCCLAAGPYSRREHSCAKHTAKQVGTNSTVDKQCREGGLGQHGKRTWHMETFLVPSGETGTFLRQSPSAKYPVWMPLALCPQAHLWDTYPIRSAQVTPAAPRLHGTTSEVLRAAGTKTLAAPFPAPGTYMTEMLKELGM